MPNYGSSLFVYWWDNGAPTGGFIPTMVQQFRWGTDRFLWGTADNYGWR